MKKGEKKLLFSAILFLPVLLTFGVMNLVVKGQSESTISPELQRRVDEAKARQAIAEARKAELEATIPLPDPESLRTETEFKEIKGEFIESRIQGYKAMETVAQKIACRIRGNVGTDVNLVLYRPEEAAMIRRYLAVMDKRDKLQQWYEKLNAEADKASADNPKLNQLNFDGGIGAVANLIVEFIGLFKREETFSPSVFDIADKELIAVFFDKFRRADCQYEQENRRNVQLYYPAATPINLTPLPPSKSDLWNKVVELEILRAAVDSKIKNLAEPVEFLNKEIKRLENQPSRTAAEADDLQRYKSARNELNNSGLIQKIEALRFQSDTLREIYKGFLKEIGIPFKEEKKEEKPKEAEGEKPSATTQTTTVNVNVYNKEEEKKKNEGDASGGNFYAYLEAERLYRLMSEDKGYWIQMSVVKAGGNVRVISIPIIDIFAGSRVRFSGGAIVSYNVFGLNGQSIFSGVVSGYEKYASSKKIEKGVK